MFSLYTEGVTTRSVNESLQVQHCSLKKTAITCSQHLLEITRLKAKFEFYSKLKLSWSPCFLHVYELTICPGVCLRGGQGLQRPLMDSDEEG